MYQKLGLFSLCLAATALLGLWGCTPDKVQPEDSTEVACGLEVTAVEMSCAAYGVFGNVYFLTDKGEYLQPWEMFPTFAPVEVSSGKRYVIGYKPITRDNRYAEAIRCRLYDERVARAIPVKLTCLSEVACATVEATVSDMRPVDGCLEFVTDNGERLLPDLSHLNVTVTDGERIRFAYQMAEGIIPCGTRRPVTGTVARIICIERLKR